MNNWELHGEEIVENAKRTGFSLMCSARKIMGDCDCDETHCVKCQKELSNILNSVLAAVFQGHETRLAYQKDYRLSQVADMLCTFRILEERAKTNTFTHSELLIFGSRRELLKNYIKPLKKLEWK